MGFVPRDPLQEYFSFVDKRVEISDLELIKDMADLFKLEEVLSTVLSQFFPGFNT
jgi:hypothetical protein